MKNTRTYVEHFFDTPLADSGIPGRSYLLASLEEFLDCESKGNAFAVYAAFFDCFRINLEGTSFIDLLDALNAYEEQSSVLLDKQRDHFIHSVNVFILGLSIYAKNPNFRRCFDDSIHKAGGYEGALPSTPEEFLYRWGLAALLHDIGYPLEIIHNQFAKFISFISETVERTGAGPYLDYFNFPVLDSISEIIYKSAFARKFLKTLPPGITLDPLRPTHLLACAIHRTFETQFSTVLGAITAFLSTMQKKGFVDHGFYSAIIVLKWYGYLIQKSGMPPDILYNPVLDAAGAIFLHNYYRSVLMKPPFAFGALEATRHPIGFLLIMCDELQEWNRTAYGTSDKKRVLAETGEVEVSGDSISVRYETSGGVMSDNFSKEKAEKLGDILQLSPIFPHGVQLSQTTNTELYLRSIQEKDEVIARPLLENLEEMAKIIHAKYVAKVEAGGGVAEYPTWEVLPDSLRYSNIRQARSVYAKLTSCGFEVCSAGEEAENQDGRHWVEGFTAGQIEMLARDEHDEWVTERLANGWTHGERDTKKKQSPYLIPYTALTEEIKDFDRDAVRNIFPMLKRLGLRVYEKKQPQSHDEP